MGKVYLSFMLVLASIQILISQTIVFQQGFRIDKLALQAETEIDTSTYTLEEIEELKESDEQFSIWIDEIADKESKERYYYTVGEEHIRYRRSLKKPGVFFDDEWILIDRDTRVMNHYYIDYKKGLQKTEFPFDRSEVRNIEVNYETKEHKDDRKTILGYDCFRVIVIETIIDDEFGTEINEYDMYVTDEINLPFHLLNTTLKPIVDSCPLQLTTYHKDKGSSFSIMNALQILEGSESDSIELPERFIMAKTLQKR